MRCSVFIAASLDGYIARADGSLDWLPQVEGEDFGYEAFIAEVDTLVMGRTTYDVVRSFGAWPFGERRVVVLTTRAFEPPPEATGLVTAVAGTPREVIAALSAEGRQHAYIDGGQVVQQFLAAGCVDTLTVSRIPVLLGGGIPLFGALPTEVRLEHVRTRAYPAGLVQSTYRVR